MQKIEIKDLKQLPHSSEIIRENILFKPKIKIDYVYRDVRFDFVTPFVKAGDVEYHYKKRQRDYRKVKDFCYENLQYANESDKDQRAIGNFN